VRRGSLTTLRDLIEPLLSPWPDKARGSQPVPDELYVPTVGDSPRVRRAPAVRVRDSADVTDAIDGTGAALASRPAEPEKSAQRGRLAQQH
jgi:hypothetical protein